MSTLRQDIGDVCTGVKESVTFYSLTFVDNKDTCILYCHDVYKYKYEDDFFSHGYYGMTNHFVDDTVNLSTKRVGVSIINGSISDWKYLQPTTLCYRLGSKNNDFYRNYFPINLFINHGETSVYFETREDAEKAANIFKILYNSINERFSKIKIHDDNFKNVFYKSLMTIYCGNPYQADALASPFIDETIINNLWPHFEIGYFIIGGRLCKIGKEVIEAIRELQAYDVSSIRFEFDYKKIKAYKKRCMRNMFNGTIDMLSCLGMKKD